MQKMRPKTEGKFSLILRKLMKRFYMNGVMDVDDMYLRGWTRLNRLNLSSN